MIRKEVVKLVLKISFYRLSRDSIKYECGAVRRIDSNKVFAEVDVH